MTTPEEYDRWCQGHEDREKAIAEEAFARGIEAAAKVADERACENDALAATYRAGGTIRHGHLSRAEEYRQFAAAIRALAKGETR